MPIYSVDDIWDDVLKYSEEVNEARDNIAVVKNGIVIKRKNYEYPIPIDGFSTAKGAIECLAHLKRKAWCNDVMFQEICRAMIQAIRNKDAD